MRAGAGGVGVSGESESSPGANVPAKAIGCTCPASREPRLHKNSSCSCREMHSTNSRIIFRPKMFENLCALPVEHDIFVQAIHPEEPIIAVGLASGHVQTYRLPSGASDDDGDETIASEKGFGTIDKVWDTRRHKGSCRTLGYSVDGTSLYSAGTDGMVKVADCMTGQVTAKICVPLDP